MKSVGGMLRPKEGTILFEGEDVTGRKPFQLVRRGICYVPDDRRIFSDLTVDDNLGIVYRRTREWDRERVYDLFPALREIAGRQAGVLSGGEKAMLALGRALMSSPKLLLLDEPTEGLAPLIVRSLEEQILRLKGEGISILLSEQNLKSSLALIDRAYIIDNGRIRYQGTAKELEDNEEIKRMHLMI
jgi:branched-chain amino acid transport system ATP-binding protein